MKNAERICSECEEPISAARLREIPNTTLCVGCKTKLEKQPKTKTRENPEKVKKSRKGRRRGPDPNKITEIG
jgi:RNA polymerase-binding transcription factor DksA